MKIKWLKSSLYEPKEVNISCSLGEFVFSIIPLSSDFYVKLGKELPPPTPVKEFARDSKGKLERDEKGNVLRVDVEDDKFRNETAEIQNLQSVAMIYESLKSDPQIEFSSQKDSFANKKDFYRAIEKEINESLPMPVFLALLDAISKRNVTISMDEAKKNSR